MGIGRLRQVIYDDEPNHLWKNNIVMRGRVVSAVGRCGSRGTIKTTENERKVTCVSCLALMKEDDGRRQ